MSADLVLLFGVTLVASAITGGLGFGFSTLLVPVGLTVTVSRVLNPAVVLLEVPQNLLALALNRKGLRKVWRATLPLLAGLLPGVIAGSLILAAVATQPLKAATYLVLLPLVLLQLSGARSPFSITRPRFGVPAGLGLGILYATTTISGPPLAMLLGNQELEPDEFRASMALVRVVEGITTLIAYLAVGLVTAESIGLATWLLPAVAIGTPIGRLALRRLDRRRFRRIYLSVDTILISTGLAVVSTQLGWIDVAVAVPMVTLIAGVLVGREWQRALASQGDGPPGLQRAEGGSRSPARGVVSP